MEQYITQHRRGTTSEWQQIGAELIPYEGEIVIEICDDNQHRLKIGDGIHTYEQLAYMVAGDATVTQALIRIASITLDSTQWTQDSDDRWHQVVDVVGTTVTDRDKVDLQPSAEQWSVFREKKLAFVTENNGGVVSAYCVGQVPQDSYTIQVAVLGAAEVAGDVIVGNTVTAPNAQSDWTQTDETRADYIKNKSEFISRVDSLELRLSEMENGAVSLVDIETGTAYKLYVSDGKLMLTEETENVLNSNGITLIDTATGDSYGLGVVNGKLTLTKQGG